MTTNDSDSRKTIHKCAGCGQRVTIYSSGEGTNSYEPWCETEIERLKTLNDRAKDVLEKTLDCEASASVARNRLEIELEKYKSALEEAREGMLKIEMMPCMSDGLAKAQDIATEIGQALDKLLDGEGR